MTDIILKDTLGKEDWKKLRDDALLDEASYENGTFPIGDGSYSKFLERLEAHAKALGCEGFIAYDGLYTPEGGDPDGAGQISTTGFVKCSGGKFIARVFRLRS